MSKICQFCHARIDDTMKICPNCAKIIPANKKPVQTFNERPPQQDRMHFNNYQNAPKRVYEHPNRRPVVEEPDVIPCASEIKPEHKKRTNKPHRSHNEDQKHKKRLRRKRIFSLIKVAIVIFVIYAGIFAAQVFRIRHSKFDFSIDLEMSRNNYGEAIDGYFKSGSWSYNPVTFTATYKGENKTKDEYEIKFNAFFDINIKSISIDGEEVKKDKFESEIMGMFI